MSSPPPALSEAILERIERNRLLALEKLRKHREASATETNVTTESSVADFVQGVTEYDRCTQATSTASQSRPAVVSEDAPPSPDPLDEPLTRWTCGKALSSGKTCTSSFDRQLRDQFGEIVCFHCKSDSGEYECISKEAIKREYLLPDAMIKQLKFISKPNAMNPRWANIKLFLRKHCIDSAMQKWGSLEALQMELRARETDKYEKSVLRTQVLFNSSAAPSDGTEKRNSVLSGKGRKRKVSALEDMVAVIRGTVRS